MFNLTEIVNKVLPSKIINTDAEAVPAKIVGSNVEKIIGENVVVSANSSTFLTVDLTNVKEFVVSLEGVSSANLSWEVKYRLLSQAGGWLDGTSVNLISPTTILVNNSSDVTKAKTTKILLYIINKSTTESMTVGKVYFYPKG